MTATILNFPLASRDRSEENATPAAIATQLGTGECLVLCPVCASRKFHFTAPTGRIFCAGCNHEIAFWRVMNPRNAPA